jgi:hypothetical protein
MNRWYLDTEFLEDGVTIDLISIALVSEDGKAEYYAGNSGCSIGRIQNDPWLMKYVWPHLPPYAFPGGAESFWKTKDHLRADLLRLFDIVRGTAIHGQPEIWADFASYDWVAFCQIFGRMIDLPSGLPMFCMDLMQDLRQQGIKRSELPKQDPQTEHSAIEDARWLRKAHRFAQGLNW